MHFGKIDAHFVFIELLLLVDDDDRFALSIQVEQIAGGRFDDRRGLPLKFWNIAAKLGKIMIVVLIVDLHLVVVLILFADLDDHRPFLLVVHIHHMGLLLYALEGVVIVPVELEAIKGLIGLAEQHHNRVVIGLEFDDLVWDFVERARENSLNLDVGDFGHDVE